MDIMDASRRSALMGRIRGRDTAPELAVRKALHAEGFRFRLHRRDLPGKPDVVLPRHRTVVFVHGCFWHRHDGCRKATIPATRTEFWEAKFSANIARDARNTAALAAAGWRVVVIWECETEKPEMLKAAIAPVAAAASTVQSTACGSCLNRRRRQTRPSKTSSSLP